MLVCVWVAAVSSPPMGVAARSRPRALRLGVAGEVARWFETAIAFACLCLCGLETAIAFAGEKWAFLVRFSGAEVSSVSAVPCWRCAVVLLVSTSLCFCVLCAMFVALLGLMWVRARKSSPSALKTPQIRRFCAVLCEFCRGSAAGGAVLDGF